MRCEEVRQTLGPEPGPRPATPEFSGAFGHLEHCPACRRFFNEQRALRERLHRLRTRAAPASLRQRIQDAIAQEAPVRQRLRSRRRWLAGGGLLIGAAASLFLLVRAPDVQISQAVAGPLVAASQGLTPRGDDARAITTSDAGQLRLWFAARVTYDVDIPQITDAVLLGGRVAELGGIQAAAVEYLFHNQPVTYFALPSAEVMGSSVGWDEIAATSSHGYQVALWQERGLARAVVGALPRSAVVRFAAECRAKALRAG